MEFVKMVTISVNYITTCIMTKSGTHAMLSRLTSLSIKSLKGLYQEADNIFNQTDPLYTAEYLIQFHL